MISGVKIFLGIFVIFKKYFEKNNPIIKKEKFESNKDNMNP